MMLTIPSAPTWSRAGARNGRAGWWIVPPSANRPGNPKPISVVTLCALTISFAARGFAGCGPRIDQPSTLSPFT
jgi:hypothetical protein